jgi:hypothetical protein
MQRYASHAINFAPTGTDNSPSSPMKHSCFSLTRRATLFCMVFAWLPFNARSQVGPLPPQLFGHWRTTVIIGDSALDRNLVLKPDGSAARWTVTARSRDAPESGSWSVVGNTLVLSFGGQVQQSPYTLHKGQLVFPNISNRRRFWDRV